MHDVQDALREFESIGSKITTLEATRDKLSNELATVVSMLDRLSIQHAGLEATILKKLEALEHPILKGYGDSILICSGGRLAHLKSYQLVHTWDVQLDPEPDPSAADFDAPSLAIDTLREAVA